MQESLNASLVRIRTAEGSVVGAGFLVEERQILTCAHVVSQALGLDDNPRDAPQGKVSLDFPLVAPHTIFTATVVQWCPPLFDGRGDIAGLELQSEPPAGAEMVRFAPAEDVWEHPFRALGFPAGYDDGVWATGRLLGRQATNWVMMEDVKAQGFMVGPGFSGTPVWDTELQGVVGMVVAASRPAETKAAFVLPLDVLVAAWPLVEPITRQRVFLSAAPADAEFADRLRSDLESRDIVVWSEQHTFDNGHLDKEERLRRALRAAQAVVVVVSSQTRSSRTVKEHLRLADLYQRRLILVWVGEDEPMQFQQLGWRETAWIDTHLTPYLAVIEAIEANVNQHRSISALLGPAHAQSEEEQIVPRNPYRGLRPFTADNAKDFFGRDRLVEELVKDVQRLLGSKQPAPKIGRLLTIIGPSGSGKSSVVMAGLLPRLQQGALPESEDWVYLEPMVPGKHPIEALGLTLAAHFPDRRFISLCEDLEDDAARGLHVLAMQLAKQRGSKVVLLVDQFEELFTQTETEDERQRFIDLLMTAATEPRGLLIVLFTLRADFSHHLMQYPDLYLLIQAQQRPLLPMEIDDLRAVIEQPSALPDVHLTFEGNLVGDLLFEVQGQVGALPLLQFTLEQLFERRSEHCLTLSAYHEIGGVKGALSQHAEQTYVALPSEEHRRLAHALFVRLIDPGATEQDTTRRRAALSEFTLDDATQTRLLRETMDAFIAASLLTTNEVAGTTTIEVSHEAVIREWKRLAEWMRETREDIMLQQSISEDAAEWMRRGKPVDRIYRGAQLTEAQEWAKRNVPSIDEVAFLQAGVAERHHQEEVALNQEVREHTLQRRVVSRQRLLISALSIFLVVVIVLATVAEMNFLQAQAQQKHAELESQIARARALTAQANSALLQNQLDLAMLLSVKAYQTHPDYDTRSSLLTSLEYSPHIATVLPTFNTGNVSQVSDLVFSSDGRTLISSMNNGNGSVVQWDLTTNQHRVPPSSLGSAHDFGLSDSNASLSPDGQTLASVGPNWLELWNIKTGQQLAKLQDHSSFYAISSSGSVSGPTPIAFSPDGKLLALGRCGHYAKDSSGDYPCLEWQIRLWDVTSKELIGSPLPVQGGAVLSLAFSPDGKVLASGSEDKTVRLWDVVKRTPIGRPLTGHGGAVLSLAFSPHGLELWNYKTGKQLAKWVLASGSEDKTVRLWRADTGEPLGEPFIGHREGVSRVAFSPDGQQLASGSTYNIILWNVVAQSPLSRTLNQGLRPVVFSPDGRIVAASDGKMITLWDEATGRPIRKLVVFPDLRVDSVASIAFSPDGQRLASVSYNGSIILWNIVTGKSTAHLTESHDGLSKITFNPDGHILAVSTRNGIAFSPDGHILAADGITTLWSVTTMTLISQLPTVPQGRIMLWDVKMDKPIGQPFTINLNSTSSSDPHSWRDSVAFSPDGRFLATSPEYGPITLWNVATRTSIRQIDQGEGYAGLAFSSDGKVLAFSNGGTLTLWDVTKQEPIAQPFDYPDDIIQSLAFSPDGKIVATARDNDILLTDVTVESWLALACSIANRNFSAAEWDHFAEGERYQKVCPRLPVDGSVV